MSFQSDLSRICEDIAQLFNECEFRAKTARSLAAFAADRDWLQSAYDSFDWWGGAGSMADYSFSDRSKQISSWLLFSHLVRLMQAHGYTSSRAESWASTFEKWSADEGSQVLVSQ